MKPSQAKPVPPVSTNAPERKASFPEGGVASSPKGPPSPSSPGGPVSPDLSSARGPASLSPSSPSGGSHFPDPSPRSSDSPVPSLGRGYILAHPSSHSGPALPGPVTPRGSLLLDPHGPFPESYPSMCSFASDISGSSLLPDPFASRHSIVLNTPSSESVGQNLQFHGRRLSRKEKSSPSITKAEDLKHDGGVSRWLCATVILLLLCLLLLAMVTLMSIKARELEKKSWEQMETMTVKVLILSETLTQLQMGKAWKCAVCTIPWVQRADLCYLFSDLEMTWKSSNAFCLDEFSDLAVMETKDEMDFLRHESAQHFIINYGKTLYLQFWTGLLSGNATSIRLSDGTLVHINPTTGAGPNPCIVLQNGEFRTTACNRRFRFICKTKAELDRS